MDVAVKTNNTRGEKLFDQEDRDPSPPLAVFRRGEKRVERVDAIIWCNIQV